MPSHPTLNALLQSPCTIVASQVGAQVLDRAGRREIWAAYGVEASLAVLAKLHAAIDFANLDGTRQTVEQLWLNGIDDHVADGVQSVLGEGQFTFSARALIQCTKEVLEFGHRDSTEAVSAVDILRCVLAINQEHDRPQRLPGLPQVQGVDAASVQEVSDYFSARGQDFLDGERGELMVDEVASASFERTESLIASLATTHDTWRRPWPRGMRVSVVGESPAAAFEAAFGVEFDDVLAAGLLIVDQAKKGNVSFSHEDLIGRGAHPDAVNLVDQLMAIDIPSLRHQVEKERVRTEETQWMRYTFQRFPFVRLADGRLLLLKAQFAIQRFFGGLMYFELWSKLGGPGSRQAEEFQQAMASVFEVRVGETLKRMGTSRTSGGPTVVVHEKELQQKLQRGENLPSVCDWVFSSDNHVLVIDANNRVLHQPLAERTGTVEEFRNDLGHNLIGDIADSGKTKFEQLASTIGLLRDQHGLTGRFMVTEQTLFTALVAVPDSGLTYTELVDFEVVTRARQVPGLDSQNVLPPAVVTLSELHLLHGVAEFYNNSPAEVLALWRLFVASQPLPVSLQNFLPAIGITARPMNTRMIKLSQRVRDSLERRLVNRS
jgi:hypothetical protein